MRKFFLIIFAIGLFSISLWITSFRFNSDIPLPWKAGPCACDGCIREFTTGFSENHGKNPEPFFSPESHVPRIIHEYWSSLQPGESSFQLYEETALRVWRMFPSSPELPKFSPDGCRTCAVVGNSGNLIHSLYGPLIDHHDIVIRMNKAPTEGYERDVGRKTTHHVMYPASASYLDNTTHLMFFPFKKSDLDWLIDAFTPRDEKNKNVLFPGNKDLVMILNPAFIRFVHHVWLERKGLYPSTGFLTVILSLYICDEVDVFGFGADRAGNWNHYFEELENKTLGTGHHPGMDEFEIIQRLRAQGKIRFFRGW